MSALILLISINLLFSAQTIKVGLAGNFSAASASTNNPTYNPIESAFLLALEDYKIKLSKKNISIDYVKLDYQNKNELVLKTATEADDKKLDVVIGYIYSNHALLAAPYYIKNKIPMILPTATSTAINSFEKYVFRTCYDDSSQAKALYEISLQNNLKKVSIVTIPDCAYCKSLTNSFVELNKEQKISTQVINASIEDINSLNGDGIKRFNPDAVLVATHEKEAGQIVSHLFDQGIKPRLWLGGDGWGNVQSLFFNLIKPRTINAYTISHWFKDAKTANSVRFHDRFKNKYNLEPADSAILAYESSVFLFESLLNNVPGSVNDKLQAQKSFPGLLGTVKMASNTKALKKMVILQQKDGQVKFLKIMDSNK